MGADQRPPGPQSLACHTFGAAGDEYEARWLLKVDDVKNDGMRYVLLTRRRE